MTALETCKAGDFGASIGGDPIDYPPTRKAVTYIDCARTVRHLAKPGEVIEVYGPRGIRRFRLEGLAMLLRRTR